MPLPRAGPLVLVSVLLGSSVLCGAESPALSWPEITRENKPWTRWWWPGSAVDKQNLTRQLEQFAAAGLGGVEITPIYGALGYEERYIDFLTPQWMEMLEHVGLEGKRLGLGIDMATGTGWPFGGPWIDEANALARAVLKDGRLAGEPTRMKVKRAAPGSEGLVVDPYSPDALRRYLDPFSKVFANFPRDLVRGQFHDSFEYYHGTWTPKFAETFRELHGYDVQQFAADILAKPGDATAVDRDTLARIKSDYRDVLAKLHLEYLRTWVQWSHERGWVVRNQSHGAPGNLLDLYANADIAETEVFGSTPFGIPGLRRSADEIRHDMDLPDSLVVRMASSAAHVVGHPLVSSESATWLREHWKVSPSYIKPELDRILADGVNHIFYHGTVYSPQDAPWPGWLFYASTQFNPNNPLWDDFAALNRYVARVQSILQRSRPDNDILVYWPVSDIWDNPDGLLLQLSVHDVKWITEQPVGKLALQLQQKGYTFDYVSDAQLEQTRVEDRQLATAGSRYKVLVVPAARRLPLATLQRIAQLAADGAHVIFQSLPEDVPGHGRLDARRAEFKRTLAALPRNAVVRSDVLAELAQHSAIAREEIADHPIAFIRRATDAGHDYFFVNLGAQPLERCVTLGRPAASARILDPLTGRSGIPSFRRGAPDNTQIFLQLAPGESLIVRTASTGEMEKPTWPYRQRGGASVELHGTWTIAFTAGGPVLPPPLETAALRSWTELGGDEAQRFAGTARYRLEFEAPTATAEDWALDLGDVRESARVRLNGHDLGTAWSIPFRLRVGEHLKPGRNALELDVTNLAANRIRDMDRRGEKWQIMREINFVNIHYKPFDASGWSLTPSGLLGPVRLVPLKALTPQR